MLVQNTIYTPVGKLCECDNTGVTKLSVYAMLYLGIYNIIVELFVD